MTKHTASQLATAKPPVLTGPTGVGDLGEDEVPGQQQRRGFLAWFWLAWFGGAFASGTIAGAAIPRLFAVLDPDAKEVNLSVASAIGGVVVIAITPLFGRLSDRTMSRWGIRRPWLVGGMALALVSIAILSLADGLVAVIVGLALGQIGFGAMNMVTHALIADQVPKRIRARTAGLLGVGGTLAVLLGAQVVGALPSDASWSWFVLPGVIGVALCLGLAIGLRDIVRTDPAPPLDLRQVLSTYWLNPLHYRNFAWAWLCRLLVTMSIVSVANYLLYFIIDVRGEPVETASATHANALLVFAIGNVSMTLLFGWISDRTGRRKPIVLIACALSAAGLALLVVGGGDPVLFWVALGTVGAAQGAFISVDIALMTEVLPDVREAGKDLGIVALSYQIPQLLVPVMAIWLLPLGDGQNYQALYSAALVFGVLGALCVIPIRGVR